MSGSIPSDIPQRQCSHPDCQQWFPATLNYFHTCRGGKYGLSSWCKQCRSKAAKRRRKEDRESLLKRQRLYRETHGEKIRQYRKEYAHTHREELREKSRRYYEQNTEKAKQATKRYEETHREAVIVRKHRRRARAKNSGGSHTAANIRDQYKRQKGKCYYCHKKVGTGKGAFHVDHIIPLALGGSDGPENLVIACPPCNLYKNVKMPNELGFLF